jgi:hypothetical protein
MVAHAQSMESASYQIQSDSINVGGAPGSSTTYRLEDTLGEVGTGNSDSASYQLRAGYQQMNEVYLALSAAADVSMAPSLGGIVGGTANGQTAATATTDSLAGYELSIRSSSSPALQKGTDTIADFSPGGTPALTFSVSAGTAAFGYSPEGADIVQRFLDNGGTCDAVGGSDTTDACWDGLSTSPVVVARRTSANHPTGTQTVVKFRTGVGANANVPEGTYTATTTLTLVAL